MVTVLVDQGHPVALVHNCLAQCGDGTTRLFRARAIPLDDRWTVTGPDHEATLAPSILCDACGLLGHWRDGSWVPC